MNAIAKFTFKSLRANKVRTFVTIAGVALAAALLAAVLTSYTSLNDYLYRSEAASSGTWMAKVDGAANNEFEEKVASAAEQPYITGMASLTDVGFGKLTQEQQEKLGKYQAVISAEGDIQTLLGIKADEGRLPQTDEEVLLYRGWQKWEGVELGDEITLSVGQRVAKGEGEISGMKVSADLVEDPDAARDFTIKPGSVLDSSVDYLDESTGVKDLTEKLVDEKSQTYKVVGFYDSVGYTLYNAVGTVALTVGRNAEGAYSEVYMTMDDVHSFEDVRERTEELFPDSHYELHSSMLQFMGISSGTSLWSTFFGLVWVLAAIIILACVSLIFNAFGISVAERVRQFGLLSSIGTTKRQIRFSVALEALLVALIGIPLGILIGIGGCAITFAILGPAIAELVRNGVVPFKLAINPTMIAIVAALSAVTVFVSVLVPAIRASRSNIVESLKGADEARVSKRGLRDAQKMTDAGRLWHSRGLFARIFGVGGKLSAINRKRGSSKGRSASISLALAIVLLMTAGSLNMFLGTLVDAVSGSSEQAGEVNVSAQLYTKIDAAKKPMTAEQFYKKQNDAFIEQTSIYTAAYENLSATPNAIPRGWMLHAEVPVMIPGDMLANDVKNSGTFMAAKLVDGNYLTTVNINFIDDTTFMQYVSSYGLDGEWFFDNERPCAIGVSRSYGNDGSIYKLLDTLTSTGHIEALAGAIYKGKYPVFVEYETSTDSPDSPPETRYSLYASTGEEDGLENLDLKLDDIDYKNIGIDIDFIAEEAPAIVGDRGEHLNIVMPMTIALSQGFGISSDIFKASFDSADGDHAQLASELSHIEDTYFLDENIHPFELAFVSYNDTLEEITTRQMMATIVNVFCLLFTIILALIALANVFNTVTNSLILRKREFAVMRSIGMSNKQFRRMVASECMRFGIVGLIPGLVISTGIAYLIYRLIGVSLGGLTFTLPWGYVLLAVGMTALAMGVSVAYGMHRCKADNVVEALRAEAI